MIGRLYLSSCYSHRSLSPLWAPCGLEMVGNLKKKKKKFHPFAHLIHTIILQGKQREMVMPILQKGKLRLEGIETLAEEEPEAENPDFLLIGCLLWLPPHWLKGGQVQIPGKRATLSSWSQF